MNLSLLQLNQMFTFSEQHQFLFLGVGHITYHPVRFLGPTTVHGKVRDRDPIGNSEKQIENKEKQAKGTW